MQAIVETVEKVVAAHMERRDAEQASNAQQRAGQEQGNGASQLPRAYGRTAAELGHEQEESLTPLHA